MGAETNTKRCMKGDFDGNQEKSIKILRDIINEGIEPINFLNDLMEVVYFILQKKNLGNFDTDLSISESELEAINLFSKNVDISTLIIFWQFILRGLENFQ